MGVQDRGRRGLDTQMQRIGPNGPRPIWHVAALLLACSFCDHAAAVPFALYARVSVKRAHRWGPGHALYAGRGEWRWVHGRLESRLRGPCEPLEVL